MKVSVIIKALNEEDNIALCIESAMRNVADIEGEILLIDSFSTDRTLQIAAKYPVRIIQFKDSLDPSCGAAPELGYQQSSGEFIYFLDGDMVLADGFIKRAMAYLEDHPEVGGVGGRILDTSILTDADLQRHQRYSRLVTIKEVMCLDGGGLYRRNAIKEVGYFSHQGLAACEETELGVRLMCKGWHLIRLPFSGVYHTGHQETSTQAMFRLWKNGRYAAHTFFLRSAIGKPWFKLALKTQWFVFAPLLLHILAFVSFYVVSTVFIGLSIWVWIPMFWLVIMGYLAVKKRSIHTALRSLLSWHLYMSAGLLSIGQPLRSPYRTISYTDKESLKNLKHTRCRKI